MSLTSFHFLRPLWLLALIAASVLWGILARRKNPLRAWRGIVADHLVPFMIKDAVVARGMAPHTLLGAVLVLTGLALAGPTWLREPAPFADDQAALVIAIEVTPTMLAQDVQPSRLERAAQKIKDLMQRRQGSATALIAYAGSAHLVLPLTEDGELIASFAGELSPELMPVEGDRAEEALALAQGQLAKSGRSGSVMLITDGLAPASVARIREARALGTPPVHIYGVAAGREAVVPPGSPPAPVLDRDGIKAAAAEGKGRAVFVTPDDRDIDRLVSIVETEFTQAVNPDGAGRWRDLGYWLVPLVALLMLPWFRKGWTVHYA